MTSPHHPDDGPLAVDDLAAALAGLRGGVAFPPTPNLASAVSSVILSGAKNLDAASRPGSVETTRPFLLVPRPLAYATLALVLLLGAALSFSGDLRSAVADRLGLPGIRIELVDETPTADPTPPSLIPPAEGSEGHSSSPVSVGSTLLLGEPTGLAQAQAAVPYVIRLPLALGAPDEVYLRRLTDGPMVAVVYLARPGLPSAAETGVGALLMQFPAGPDSADIAKKVLFGEGREPSGSLTEVDVDGQPAYWITGASELTILEDPSASYRDDPSRPSANVLLWAAGGITYRLETALPLTDALALAESLAPAEGTGSRPALYYR